MKRSFFVVCLSLLVAGSSFTSVRGAQPGKPETPAVVQARNAKLTELRRQQAANAAEIQRLRARIKQDADRRAALARQGKTPQPTDSISDMNSTQQLKLQQLMDQRTKLEEELSRIMKEASDAAKNITDNLK